MNVHFDRETGKPVFGAAEEMPPHAKACKELYDRSGGFYNARAFMPFLYHDDGAPPGSTLIFPGATGSTNWGGMAIDSKGGLCVCLYAGSCPGWLDGEKEPGGGVCVRRARLRPGLYARQCGRPQGRPTLYQQLLPTRRAGTSGDKGTIALRRPPARLIFIGAVNDTCSFV
jgi:hypothetical protein